MVRIPIYQSHCSLPVVVLLSYGLYVAVMTHLPGKYVAKTLLSFLKVFTHKWSFESAMIVFHASGLALNCILVPILQLHRDLIILD